MLQRCTLSPSYCFYLFCVSPPFALFVLAVILLMLSYRYLWKMNTRNLEALESWRASLSTGAIPSIIGNRLKETQVFLQVLGCKSVKGVKHDRYGLVISDGKYSYSYGMLATQPNHLVEDGQLDIFTIIKVKQFVITFPTAVGYEIILWDIVPLVPGREVGEILGNPQTVNGYGEIADVPSITNYFVPFDQVPNLEDDSIIDVIGLVLNLQEMVLVGFPKITRSITAKFVDSTNTEVELSLLEKVEDKCIVALHGVKISNKFGRRYLETLSSTVVQVNPDMSEARDLREWYDKRRNVV